MKKCEDIRQVIEHMLYEQPDKEQQEAIESHIKTCEACNEVYFALKNSADIFAAHTPEDDMVSSSFEERLHLKLSQHSNNISHQQPGLFSILKPILSLSFVFMFIIGVYFYLPEHNKDEAKLVSESIVKRNEPLTIKINYETVKNLKNVAVDIKLSDGVQFFTDFENVKDLREYTWKGDLDKGKNEVPFVVEVLKNGIFHIETVARYGGYLHRHKVVLKVDGDNVKISYYKYPKKKLAYVS